MDCIGSSGRDGIEDNLIIIDVARIRSGRTAVLHIDTEVGVAYQHVVVANEEVHHGSILHTDTILSIIHTVNGIAVDVNALNLLGIDTGEVLVRVGRGLGNVVATHHAVGVRGMDTLVARDDTVVLQRQDIASGRRADVIDTIVTALEGTVADGDAVGDRHLAGGCSRGCRTANHEAGVSRAVGRIGRYATTVEHHVGATVATEHDSSRNSRLVCPQGQVLEDVVARVHQGHRTEQVITGIGMVVRDNDRVDIVALEGDGIGGRLADVIVGKVKILIGAGTQMERRRTIDTAIVQGGLHLRHRSEIGVGATHRVVTVQQAVASIADVAQRIAGGGGGGAVRGRGDAVETVGLAVTGGNVNRDIVESVCRGDVTQAQGTAFVEAERTGPVVGGSVRLHVVLILHLDGHAQICLVRAARRVGRITLVLEIDSDRFRRARNEAVRESVEAVQMTVVVMDIALVVPSDERSINRDGGAAVHIAHTDLIADGVEVTDRGEVPLGKHHIRATRGGIGSDVVRHRDSLATVDAVTELQAVHLHLVVIRYAHLDGVGSDIVQQVAVLVDINRRLQGDGRLDQLAVREDALQVVDVPTRASLGTGCIRGGLVDTETDTDVRGRVVNTRHRHHLIHQERGEIEELVLPPIVVGCSRR